LLQSVCSAHDLQTFLLLLLLLLPAAVLASLTLLSLYRLKAPVSPFTHA
jgi:hypothetical protein